MRFLYRRIVGSDSFDDVNDDLKTKLATEVSKANTPLRCLFDKDTRADLHPNVARLARALEDEGYRSEMTESILRVNEYEYVLDRGLVKSC